MKIFSRILVSLLIVVFVLIIFIKKSNNYQKDGIVTFKILKAPVKVLRDKKGIPYIYAKNFHDLITVQGFVSAQARLFQMELTKLMAEGRISELAGDVAVKLDTRNRTIGFYRNAKKHAKILNKSSRDFLQNYVNGVNEFIVNHKEDYPIEFKLAGLTPQKWKIEDVLSIMYYMGWEMAANLNTEIISQMIYEKIGLKATKEILPINTNPDEKSKIISVGDKIDKSHLLKIGLNDDKNVLALIKKSNSSLHIGSNNWTVAPKLSKGGATLLANDPHLDARMIPGPFMIVGLIAPNIRAVGGTVAGIPGIYVGRCNDIAFGVTNSYGDAQDLYIETIDPKNANNYLEGKKSIPFKIVNDVLRIKDKKSPEGFRTKKIVIRETKRGPVISKLLPKLKTKHTVTVRWSAFETMNGSIGLDKMFDVKNSRELDDVLKNITYVMLNFVFADKKGNIGWRTTGKLPIRSQKNSTFPYVVKNSVDNWIGWIPSSKMPSSFNPKKGWLGTCNHKTIKSNYPYYISSYFSPYYRYARLKELIESNRKFSVSDFWKFQRDKKNIMAEKLVPAMIKSLSKFKDTKKVVSILSKWDFKDVKNSIAPTLFQEIYTKFAILTFSDELGKDLTDTMLDVQYYWQNRLENMVLLGKSKWFDNIKTKKVENMDDIFHEAASIALENLKKRYGAESNWNWGNVHKISFYYSVARKGLLKKIFGKEYPMGGSSQTLYRANSDPTKPFNVNFSAALRMVVDLSDDEKITAVMSSGESARIFDINSTDQTDSYMNGDYQYWWFSDKSINQHKEFIQILKP